ncbi:MAG: hypothetical protein FJW95_02185, partial [Actinobacteria bacterium]|nr:hypothetical protein [Actinomycetota bacterium]
VAGAAAPAAAVAAALTATDTRVVTRTAIVVAAHVDAIRGTEVAEVDVLAADEKAADRPEEALHAQLRLRSLWFRNALRAAVALMIAVAIVLEGVGSGHGFWVALGAFTVLRADFGTVKRSARTTVVGTAIGFALSSLVVLWGEHREIVVWVALAAGLFLAAYGSRFRPEVGSAAFTVLVVSMYTLTEPAGLRTGEVRLLNVTIGATVTLLVTFVLWPRAGRAPAQVVAEVVAGARRSLADAVARRPVGEPYALVTDLDRVLDVVTTSAPQAFSDRERARIMLTVAFTTNVAEFLGHPRSSAPVPLARATRLPAAWAAVVDDADRIDGALASLVARLEGRPAPPLPPPPDAVVGMVTQALTEGEVDDAEALSAAVRTAAVLRRVHEFAAAPVGTRLTRVRAGSPPDQPTRTGTSE